MPPEINDTTHDALATPRIDARNARTMFSNSPEEIRVKKDDSIVRNIETAIEKEELDTTSKPSKKKSPSRTALRQLENYLVNAGEKELPATRCESTRFTKCFAFERNGVFR